MFSVFILIMNFVCAVMAGVVLSAVMGFEWWILTFIVGFVLWNVAAASIVLVVGILFMNDIERGK